MPYEDPHIKVLKKIFQNAFGIETSSLNENHVKFFIADYNIFNELVITIPQKVAKEIHRESFRFPTYNLSVSLNNKMNDGYLAIYNVSLNSLKDFIDKK